jgi:leucyl-tRNA synthetase
MAVHRVETEEGRYDFGTAERKWQQAWAASGMYRTPEAGERPKYYMLTMYPYPSGDFHVGHWYAVTPADVYARYKRMRGHDVLFPIGFDAFGLPAENAAIKRGIHPHEWTMRNIERMRAQLRSMGAMFDWSREVVTCDPRYYRWNQWFFLRFLEGGLAYKKRAPVDWCPHCNTTLAREQVWGEDRHCERCDTPVVKKDLDQWFFRITHYADELLSFDAMDWPERVKVMQTNWIGRSEGTQFRFEVGEESFEVFTTRIDTLYGCTFAVLAPEHPLVEKITTAEQRDAVTAYVSQTSRESEIERLSTARQRTGVFTGAHAKHPLTGEPVPIWIADYVLMTYGTGAIMAVPGHDERDFDFAQRHGLPIPRVIEGGDLPYTGPGRVVNSGPYTGMDSDAAWNAIADQLERSGIGRRTVQYRLRDWLVSRQRYWGTPIPVVYCDSCGIVPVPESDLPVILPPDAEFRPTGESPLLRDPDFLNTTCPKCGGPARRETDTMDTFVDSSWYMYRYLSPHDDAAPFDPAAAARWLPVDTYTGGIEHAILHLMYMRFFTKAMRDLGLVSFGEPALRLRNQGIILGENNEKMSKSRGNVVNPDDLVARYGADGVRLFLMFIGPWDQGGPWNSRGIEGIARFQQRLWRACLDAATAAGGAHPADPALRRAVHQAIARVTADIDRFAFNTAISGLMTLLNEVGAYREAGGSNGELLREVMETFTRLIAPLAPHQAEEMWQRLGGVGSVHLQEWPEADPSLLVQDRVTVVVQVNGRVRDRIEVDADAPEAVLRTAALASAKVQAAIGGGEVRKVITVPNRLVNLVIQ